MIENYEVELIKEIKDYKNNYITSFMNEFSEDLNFSGVCAKDNNIIMSFEFEHGIVYLTIKDNYIIAIEIEDNHGNKL